MLEQAAPAENGLWYKLIVEGDGDLYGFLSIESRPSYCDRGRFIVKPFVQGVHIDGADSFPRYYFEWSCLATEIRAWLEARGLEPKRLEACK